MSLDVYLRSGADEHAPCEGCGGTGRVVVRRGEVFEWNVTHNLDTMAEAAGVYRHLWRPDEIGVTKARQLIEPLRAGLELLRSDPARFEALNPANGWGDYAGLVRFVAAYLAACEDSPDADVWVSR